MAIHIGCGFIEEIFLDEDSGEEDSCLDAERKESLLPEGQYLEPPEGKLKSVSRRMSNMEDIKCESMCFSQSMDHSN